MKSKIGFGGGCHWCTEAVFQFIEGVSKVEQGWISSVGDEEAYSEAVLLEVDTEQVSMESLVAIHLHTHSSTSNHPMRTKYRSAIYYFSESQKGQLEDILAQQQNDFEKKIITRVLPFGQFEINKEKYRDYYQKNKTNSFCNSYIHPKLRTLLARFSKNVGASLREELSDKKEKSL